MLTKEIIDRLFPDIHLTVKECERRYPKRILREGACVTRFAPSPTGFLHIGGLFSALASERAARLSGGRFILRIEDTDKKREMEDGVTGIIQGMQAFGVVPDEGVTGNGTEIGDYGPYLQSARREIYGCYAKKLVEEGKAYPCFMTPAELAVIRSEQEADKQLPGCYGKYAKYRDAGADEINSRLDAGDEYVIRLRSPGKEGGKVGFTDRIKGEIEMPENITDVVILKSDGLPTYHFAHAVDDELMGTTHVVRGDEWIASAPIHLQLFEALGFKAPVYSHIAPILKEDNGGKRKISKRKDPEAAVTYFIEEGYPPQAVIEYLLTLLNSGFEDWRRDNMDRPYAAFPFELGKMSASGALFDIAKLSDISKTMISKMSADEVCDAVLAWSKQYDPALCDRIAQDYDYSAALFSIDRGGDKPRKDIARWNEVSGYYAYLFDDTFYMKDALPEKIMPSDAIRVLETYAEIYDETLEKDEWFSSVKGICEGLGFAGEVKAYKKNPEKYKGHVGDVSTVIRLATTGRMQTPDLCAILKLLGKKRVQARLKAMIKALKEETE